jgi:arsenate reductase
MTATMFGIKNCDTVAKARAWLAEHAIAYDFHDYKALGVDAAHLQAWCHQFGWEKVLNRSGTTFRKLPDVQKADLNEAKAIALMIAQPSMIKRPVFEMGELRLIGFDPQAYAAALT